MKIFLSHSGSDKDIVTKFCELLDEKSYDFFYSSRAETGVKIDESILQTITKNINKCKKFIAIITPNFLRSSYCLYELSVAISRKLSRKDIKIIAISTQDLIRGRIESLLPLDNLFLDIGDKDNRTNHLSQGLKFRKSKKEIDNVLGELNEYCIKNSTRPLIGMTKNEYESVMKYCESKRIIALREDSIPDTKLNEHIANAKEIIILSTTGAGLIKKLCADNLHVLIANGTNVKVIIPNQYSAFCDDVAEIENPLDKSSNIKRLKNEFEDIFTHLKNTVNKAKELTSDGYISGSVTFYCAYNILRQTILLTVTESGELWGNITLTMPPRLAIKSTPSIEVEGQKRVENCVEDKDNENKTVMSLAEIALNHCEKIIEMAEHRGGVIKITGDNIIMPFFKEKQHAKEYWKKKYDDAHLTMSTRKENEEYEKILIEVAAQHPLKAGTEPNTEFKKRLDFAVNLYNDFTKQKLHAFIYVPGSVHKTSKSTDEISLSEAGCKYLISKEIPCENIFGEDMNKLYKGIDGVYNSADECFVASKIFLNGDYKKLYCICSPNQVMRKTLFYIEFGILPQCYCVPCETMYHTVLDEIFTSLETVIYKDHSWQDSTSETFINSRRSRKP